MLANPSILDPRIVKLMTRLNPKTYQGFIDFLYSDLDGILRELQASRKLTVQKYPEVDSDDIVFKVFEDDINTQIVRDLKLLEYDAVHDKFDNGHVDIHVEISGFPYRWLGESKIWKGVSKIEGGFKQLLEDYSTGEENANRGGVLIYAVDTEYNTNQMLKIWYEELAAAAADSTRNQNLDGLTLNWPDADKNIFYSTQIHPHSGLSGYMVRHCVLNLKSIKNTEVQKTQRPQKKNKLKVQPKVNNSEKEMKPKAQPRVRKPKKETTVTVQQEVNDLKD